MSLLSTFLTAPPPNVALEIAPGRVTGVRLTGGARTIAAHASRTLPPAAVVPSLLNPNIIDPAAVTSAVREVMHQIGGGRRAALVLPDDAARVSLVRFESVPARPSDLEAMLRWQVRKSVPFRMDDAQVSWAEGMRLEDGSREFIVVIARRDVVAQYEQACEAAGVHVGLVDIATFDLVNLVLAASPDRSGDWLLVYVTPLSTSLAVVRDGILAFYRHRSLDEEQESLSDLVHQTAMYYEDRLAGRGFARVLLAGAGESSGAAEARRQLQDRLGARVESVDPLAAASLDDRRDPGPELRDRLAPLVGILVRERAA